MPRRLSLCRNGPKQALAVPPRDVPEGDAPERVRLRERPELLGAGEPRVVRQREPVGTEDVNQNDQTN